MNVQQLASSAPSCCTNPKGAEMIEFVLKLSNGADFIVPVRRDGYVNVTKICQAAGKRLQHYRERVDSQHFLDRYVALTGIPANAIFEVIQGGNLANVEQGTYAHPDIAIHIAQWCSADFSIQVSRWVRQLMTTGRVDVRLQFYMWNDELLLTGRVELGNEMNVQKLAPSAPSCCTNTNGVRKPLVLNGLMIEVDPDTFMVNATQMCKAAGKLFGHYWQLDSTKKYLQELSSDIGIPISELYKKTNGGRQDLQGTCVHFRLAVHLAHWLSTEVQVQFSKWIAELLLTGRVELGNEMNVQKLEDVWKRRIEEGEAKAAVDLDAERNRCQEIILQKNELELQLATIQESQQLTKAAQEELMAIKAREDLETTIRALVNNTAPIITSYKDGDNALYLARIDETKFKYGHTKNIGQRFDAHMRPGVYPMFEPVGIFQCTNGVASEEKIRDYVKKEKIKMLRIKDKDRFTSCFFMHRFICKIRANDCVINDAKATPGIESNGKRTKISTKLNPKIK